MYLLSGLYWYKHTFSVIQICTSKIVKSETLGNQIHVSVIHQNLLECTDTFFCVLKAFPDESKNNAFLKILLLHRKKNIKL